MLEDKNQDTIDLLLFHQKSARRGKNVQPNMQKRVHKNVENQHYHQNKTKSQNRTRRQLSAGKKKETKTGGVVLQKAQTHASKARGKKGWCTFKKGSQSCGRKRCNGFSRNRLQRPTAYETKDVSGFILRSTNQCALCDWQRSKKVTAPISRLAFCKLSVTCSVLLLDDTTDEVTFWLNKSSLKL